MWFIKRDRDTRTEPTRTAILSRTTAPITRTAMDTPNRIIQRRITRIDIRSRISQIDIPIHGRTQRIDITMMAIIDGLVTAESESSSG